MLGKRQSYLVVCIGVLLIPPVKSAQAFRSGPPAARNGSTASGGATCRQCHGNVIGSGSVQILGVPLTYQANTIYNLTIRVSDPVQAGAGCQISAESSTGVHRGTFLLNDTNMQFNSSWVNHTDDGVNNAVANWVASGNSADYTVRWQAPSTDVGGITFWAAGNAINNNFNSTGDLVYLTSITATFGAQTGACCDDDTGTCTENRTQAACEADGFRYGGNGSTCGTINPQCQAPIVGACCDVITGTCTENEPQADCETAGFTYGGDDSVCSDFDPPCVVFSIGLEPVGTVLQRGGPALTSPIIVTHANDNSGRLFVVDQIGKIRIIDSGGDLLPTPFLDISGLIPVLNTVFDERGLLGLAFHPDYANNGRFFIRYSLPRAGLPEEPCNDPGGFIVGCHEEILAEYAVSGNPNVANPGSEIILFRVDKPQFNHNGGAVTFGPDGMLYFTFGDGGGAHDGLADVPPSHGPIGNGQNKDTALGKVLRIDVDPPFDPGLNYAVPPTNPFVGVAGLDEIFAFGLRNPFAMSFDDGPGGTGQLFVADVGQALFEEVDIVVNGGNYGWVIREGFHCFDPFNPGNPPVSCPSIGAGGEPLLDPISEYNHTEGGVSIIGGYVYRGSAIPTHQELYVYGDFSADFGPTGRLYYFETTGPNANQRRQFSLSPDNAPFGRFLKGFGEDKDGELYVCASTDLGPTGTSGLVLKIVAPVAATIERDASRYLSIIPPPSPMPIALRVRCAGNQLYNYLRPPVGPENISVLDDDGTPFFRTSAEWGPVVHVTGTFNSALDILPDTDYNVAVDVGDVFNPALSAEVVTTTAEFGDITDPIGGPPEGTTNFVDISGAVARFRGLPGAPPIYRADLRRSADCKPDQVVNFVDISDAVLGFRTLPNPCAGPCP